MLVRTALIEMVPCTEHAYFPAFYTVSTLVQYPTQIDVHALGSVVLVRVWYVAEHALFCW